jgi:hypothetical protein
MKGGRRKLRLEHDLAIIGVSVLAAILFGYLGIFEWLIEAGGRFYFLDSFIAGLFFTSVFTTPLSTVALGQLSLHTENIYELAAIGALGAVCGDFLIYKFVKDRLGGDLLYILGPLKKGSLKPISEFRIFRYLTFLVGGLIIASPFPDELGIAMMGLSKTKSWAFFPVSYVFNFIGIFLIATIARTI